jgi:hypothetical protein
MRKLNLWGESDPRSHIYPACLGTYWKTLLSLFHPNPTPQASPLLAGPAQSSTTMTLLSKPSVAWAVKEEGMKTYFQVSFSGNQLGPGPGEADIYVLSLITLADIFQTTPADTLLTRAQLSSRGYLCMQAPLPRGRCWLWTRAAAHVPLHKPSWCQDGRNPGRRAEGNMTQASKPHDLVPQIRTLTFAENCVQYAVGFFTTASLYCVPTVCHTGVLLNASSVSTCWDKPM